MVDGTNPESDADSKWVRFALFHVHPGNFVPGIHCDITKTESVRVGPGGGG